MRRHLLAPKCLLNILPFRKIKCLNVLCNNMRLSSVSERSVFALLVRFCWGVAFLKNSQCLTTQVPVPVFPKKGKMENLGLEFLGKFWWSR